MVFRHILKTETPICNAVYVKVADPQGVLLLVLYVGIITQNKKWKAFSESTIGQAFFSD